MKKAIDFFTAHPARFFLLAAVLWGGFMCYLNSKDVGPNGFSWHDLLVEANGMVFDLLVFGILLSIYERLREKRDKIERLHEEIDDYRGWDEKEAMFRIVGAVKRLKKLGVTYINLSRCNFRGASLEGLNLEGTNLFGANLEGTNLIKANLKGADLTSANLKGANLWYADLEKTVFFGANLEGAGLLETNLGQAIFWNAYSKRTIVFWTDIEGVTLQKTSLEGAVLHGSKVGKDWFEKLEDWDVMGRKEIKAKYLIDEQGVLREKQ